MSDVVLDLRDKVMGAPRKGKRRVVALGGPPASGKTTLAGRLANALDEAGCKTQVVPMDGFHLDNRILSERNLLHRKGAPETFDVRGLLSLVPRLANGTDVAFPVFDRALDMSIGGAGVIASATDTLIVEGNYVLVDMHIWRELAEYWDITIALRTPEKTLRERLIKRWQDNGLSGPKAVERAEGNDLVNARLVIEKTRAADVWVSL